MLWQRARTRFRAYNDYRYSLTKECNNLALLDVAELTADEAYETFKQLRWASTTGRPVCPNCSCEKIYTYTKRKLFKCSACPTQFSVTSQTIFASRKLSIKKCLIAILSFTNAAGGLSSLEVEFPGIGQNPEMSPADRFCAFA